MTIHLWDLSKWEVSIFQILLMKKNSNIDFIKGGPQFFDFFQIFSNFLDKILCLVNFSSIIELFSWLGGYHIKLQSGRSLDQIQMCTFFFISCFTLIDNLQTSRFETQPQHQSYNIFLEIIKLKIAYRVLEKKGHVKKLAISKKSTTFVLSSRNLLKMITSWSNHHQRFIRIGEKFQNIQDLASSIFKQEKSISLFRKAPTKFTTCRERRVKGAPYVFASIDSI